MLTKLLDLQQAWLEYLLGEAYRAGFRRISFATIDMTLRLGTEAHLVTILGEQMNKTQQATGKTLKRMRETGYVQASPVYEEDRRRHRQQLSPKGLQLLAVLLAAEKSVSLQKSQRADMERLLDLQLDILS